MTGLVSRRQRLGVRIVLRLSESRRSNIYTTCFGSGHESNTVQMRGLKATFSTTTDHWRLRKGFMAFAGRPYFQRVWVYQKLYLGRHVVIRCRAEEMNVASFYSFVSVLSGDEKAVADLGPCFQRMIEAGTLRCQDDGPGEELQVAVQQMRHLKCQDPRDKIYGMLFLLNWHHAEPISPDYGVDAFDLAVDVMSRIMRYPCHDFALFFHQLDMARVIAGVLQLQESPPPRLLGAAWNRRRGSLPRKLASESRTAPDRRHYTVFMGWRLVHGTPEEPWQLRQTIGGVSLGQPRYGPPTGPVRYPKVHQWNRGCAQIEQDTQVLLPDYAEAGDILLIPFRATQTGFCTTVALLAKEYFKNSEYLNVHSKALLNPCGCRDWLSEGMSGRSDDDSLFSEAMSVGEEAGTKIQVYFDPEDTIALLASCHWDTQLNFPTRSGQDLDAFFDTGVCGTFHSSHAVPQG